MAGPIRPDAVPAQLRSPRVSGVGSDQLRRHNLSAILTLLHHDGSQPRSMLTAQTGLNRSTVAALVGELVERGLVVRDRARSDPAGGSSQPDGQRRRAQRRDRDQPRGRRDHDRGRRARRPRSPSGSATRPTDPPTAREAVNISTAVIEGFTDELLERGRITGIGVAVPGLVRADDGLVKLAPHLDWVDEPVAAMLGRGDRLRRVRRQRCEPRARWSSTSSGPAAGSATSSTSTAARAASAAASSPTAPCSAAMSGYAGRVRPHPRHRPGRGVRSAVAHARVARQPGGPARGARHHRGQRRRARAAPARVARIPRSPSSCTASCGYLGSALGDSINILNPQRVVLGGFLATILQKDPEYLAKRVEAHALAAAYEDVTHHAARASGPTC